MSNRQIQLDPTDRVEDLEFSLLEPQYLKVQYISAISVYLILMGLAACILFAEDFSYRIVTSLGVEAVLLTAMIINLFFLPKAYRFRGYALREHDITYRKGIFFPKVTTVPFSKIQQVSVRQNPVSRLFRLHSVDVVNGAQQLASLSIPGLPEERAQQIKSVIMEGKRSIGSMTVNEPESKDTVGLEAFKSEDHEEI